MSVEDPLFAPDAACREIGGAQIDVARVGACRIKVENKT